MKKVGIWIEEEILTLLVLACKTKNESEAVVCSLIYSAVAYHVVLFTLGYDSCNK